MKSNALNVGRQDYSTQGSGVKPSWGSICRCVRRRLGTRSHL
ncbi:hypothetical protein [Gloeocapsopsis sp. IPPAS B-1203]|nr:hypothetical protein [Gloeocapsopsis sp. IPPAS B-1203]